MDAMSLALPVNKIAGPTMAGADNAALTDESGQTPIDFATLLAAGIGLQEQLLDPAAVAAPEVSALVESTTEPLTAATPTAPTDLNPALVAANILPSSGQGQERPTNIELLGARDAQVEQRLSAALLVRQGTDAAQTAAEAARFAGPAAHDADEAPSTMPLQQLDFAAETTAIMDAADAQRTGAAEAATQALNLQATEQRTPVQQPVAVREVGAPVGSTGFADELSRQVVWMVDKDAQIAELRINPPELGPVEIRLTVNGDQASAKFVSTHAEVREALETSIARLRESFAEAGIALGEASVSAESFQDHGTGQAESRRQHSGYTESRDASGRTPTTPVAAPRIHRGLVDTFA